MPKSNVCKCGREREEAVVEWGVRSQTLHFAGVP